MLAVSRGRIGSLSKRKQMNLSLQHLKTLLKLNPLCHQPSLHPKPLVLQVLVPLIMIIPQIDSLFLLDVRKPSQQVHDILEGHGATSACPSNPVVAAGVQVPPIAEEAPDQVLEWEGIAD